MDRKKIILSVIGIGALIIPIVLLLVFTSKAQKQPEIPTGERKIDPQTVEDVTRKISPPPPIFVSSPSPATTSSELEIEGSPSSQ